MVGSKTVRALVVDDDPSLIGEYRRILSVGNPAPSDSDELFSTLDGDLYDTAIGHQHFPAVELAAFRMGSDAVEAVRDGRKTDRPFSIAFVDMQLNSVLDGIETAERIRASVARIHIAIVAGRSTLHPVELATRIPPADRLSFVRKPFHPFEVQQLLLGCVHRQRIEARNSSLGNGDDDDRVANRIVLRAILDRLPVGVLVFDRRDKLIAVNAEMGRLYPDSSSLFVSGTEIGKIFQEFNLNEVVSSGVSGEQKLWQMGRGRWAKVIEGVAPNGETYCLFSDVTDLKNRDAALRRSRYEMHLTQVFATLCDTVGELLKDGTTATDTSVHAVERLRAVAKQQHLTPHIIRPSQYLSRILRRIRRRLPSGIELEMVVDAKL